MLIRGPVPYRSEPGNSVPSLYLLCFGGAYPCSEVHRNLGVPHLGNISQDPLTPGSARGLRLHFLACKVLTITVSDFMEVVKIKWIDPCSVLSAVPGVEPMSYQGQLCGALCIRKVGPSP